MNLIPLLIANPELLAAPVKVAENVAEGFAELFAHLRGETAPAEGSAHHPEGQLARVVAETPSSDERALAEQAGPAVLRWLGIPQESLKAGKLSVSSASLLDRLTQVVSAAAAGPVRLVGKARSLLVVAETVARKVLDGLGNAVPAESGPLTGSPAPVRFFRLDPATGQARQDLGTPFSASAELATMHARQGQALEPVAPSMGVDAPPSSARVLVTAWPVQVVVGKQAQAAPGRLGRPAAMATESAAFGAQPEDRQTSPAPAGRAQLGQREPAELNSSVRTTQQPTWLRAEEPAHAMPTPGELFHQQPAPSARPVQEPAPSPQRPLAAGEPLPQLSALQPAGHPSLTSAQEPARQQDSSAIVEPTAQVQPVPQERPVTAIGSAEPPAEPTPGPALPVPPVPQERPMTAVAAVGPKSASPPVPQERPMTAITAPADPAVGPKSASPPVPQERPMTAVAAPADPAVGPKSASPPAAQERPMTAVAAPADPAVGPKSASPPAPQERPGAAAWPHSDHALRTVAAAAPPVAPQAIPRQKSPAEPAPGEAQPVPEESPAPSQALPVPQEKPRAAVAANPDHAVRPEGRPALPTPGSAQPVPHTPPTRPVPQERPVSPTETNAIPERQPAEPPSTPGQSNPRERPLAPAEPRPEARPGERSEAREVPVRTPSATRASEPAAADLELKVVVRQAQASARGWEREETRSGRPGALFGADGRATPLQREQGPTPRFQAGAGLNRSAESTLLRHEPMLGVGPAPSPLNDSIQQPIVPSNTMAPGEDNGPVRLEKLAEVLKQRVRRSLEEIAKGPRQLELRLDPPRLGKIQIELTLQPDSTVTARIQAENPQALAALGSQLPELRERLAQAGVELRDFSLGQNSQNPFQQPHEGQQRRRGRHQAEAQTARPRRDSGLSLRV